MIFEDGKKKNSVTDSKLGSKAFTNFIELRVGNVDLFDRRVVRPIDHKTNDYDDFLKKTNYLSRKNNTFLYIQVALCFINVLKETLQSYIIAILTGQFYGQWDIIQGDNNHDKLINYLEFSN